MILTQTPFRISFVGGSTDLESFYSKFPGAVLSTSINKYMFICLHPYFEREKFRVKYSKSETVDSVAEIQHPVVRAILQQYGITDGIEITSTADIPSGTGLGSSSSFTVGLIHNVNTFQGKFITKRQLAEGACDIEIGKLHEPIGKQDQYAAAYGGLNIFRFESDGHVGVEPIHLQKKHMDELQQNLLMFYTGGQRSASEILTQLSQPSDKKLEIMRKMVSLVDEMRDGLYSGDLQSFGECLHRNWLLKQQTANGISNEYLDKIYSLGLSAGAAGGKLLGAGGSGFMLFYCDKEHQSKLRAAMNPLKELSFKFDHEGSKVVYIGGNGE